MRMSKSILCGVLFVTTAGGAYAIEASNLPLKTADEAKGMNPNFVINSSLLAATQAKSVNLGGTRAAIPRAGVGKVIDGHALGAQYLFVLDADFPIVFNAFNHMGNVRITGSKIAEVAVWSPVVTDARQGYVIDGNRFGFNDGWVEGETLSPEAIKYLNGNRDVLGKYFLIKNKATGVQEPFDKELTQENLRGQIVGWFDCPAC